MSASPFALGCICRVAAVFPVQGIPDSWPGCIIRAQTGAGCGDNCDVRYTGIDSQHCQIRGVMRVAAS